MFCKIVDNYGDIGVVLRLGKELKKTLENKINLRIIISKIDELIAINPKIKDLDYQEFNNITYITNSYFEKNIQKLGVANLVIETFGCGIPDYYMELAYFNSEYILNLEYLTGEKWVNDFHMKESLLPKGSVKKYFYFPGFSEEAGGLVIREQIRKKVNAHKEKYLKKYYGEFLNPEKKLKGTIFSYEKNFIPFFDALKKLDEEVILMIFSTKTQNSIKNIFNKKIFGNAYKYGKIEMKFSKFLSQDQYEEIINVSDFNFVRGEDSATMAVTSGKPFLWQLYPQENNTHMEKLEGFLDTYTTFLNKNNKNIDDKNLTANLIKLFKDYNDKVDNYLDLGNESYLYFLKNIKNIERANIVFADYLLSKCNLINKLKSFIYEFLGGKK
ncbi:MAG: elongation factor P maturation arginine rhamnosyltransferase EarP [Fusobacteriaceae bacterium]|nr:elongation factor P maturation arginine rhamnosyltransferase EarP [Fusobacteriaceae bacterium]